MESLSSLIMLFYNEENLLEHSVLDLVKEDFLKKLKFIDGLKYKFAIFKFK